MRAPFPQLVGLAILSLSLAATAGCEPLGNPFLPKAKVYISVDPQISTMKLVYREKTNDFQKTPTESKFKLGHYKDDISPGVQFKWYELKFRDQNNQEISPSFIGANRVLGTSVYLPASGSSAGSGGSSGSNETVSIETSIFNDQLINYGITNGFLSDSSGKVSLNPYGWSQDLTGRIIFHGQDDNGHEIEAEAKFTLRFDTSIESDESGAK
ncbi:MAG: hypothetical protein ACM3YO_01780 [Bacteroidota bacterium]